MTLVLTITLSKFNDLQHSKKNYLSLSGFSRAKWFYFLLVNCLTFYQLFVYIDAYIASIVIRPIISVFLL